MVREIKQLVLVGCLFVVTTMQAVTLKELFFQMPGEVCPVLNLTARRDLVDFFINQRTAVVPSVFDNTIVMKALADNCLLLQTSSVSTLQLKMLPASDSVVVAVINTVSAPLPDSRIRFFSKSWKPVTGHFLPVFLPRYFLDTTRLDAGQIERFDNLCGRSNYRMVADANDPIVRVYPSFKEDVPNELLAPYKGFISDSLILSWDGRRFAISPSATGFNQ